MKRIYALIVLFSVIILCVCGYLLYTVGFNTVFTESGIVNCDTLTVIIDAGHGGPDGGAVADDGTNEKDINLAISLKLNKVLKENGINTVMTRTEDISIHSENAKTLREKKVSDIHNRMKLMVETPNSIFVSIHQNSYTSSKYSGTQVFYSPDNTDSNLLAQKIQQSVVNNIQPDNKREIKECGSSVYLIYNAVKPAVLVECGFMTNSEELNNLKNEEYQQKMADAIASGIIDYIKGS